MKILILQKFGITFVKPINKGIDLYDYMSIGIHFIGFYEPKKNDVSAIQISKYIICCNENVGMEMGKQCKGPNKTRKKFSFNLFLFYIW